MQNLNQSIIQHEKREEKKKKWHKCATHIHYEFDWISAQLYTICDWGICD